jgi:hypothetical protein
MSLKMEIQSATNTAKGAADYVDKVAADDADGTDAFGILNCTSARENGWAQILTRLLATIQTYLRYLRTSAASLYLRNLWAK